VRLSDKAYRLIRRKIITLELPPLSVIDEQVLMEDLQLGRTPIREALQRLAGEDLVFSAPHRGMFVADISITDLQKIFEVRMVLEGFCARLAARRITPEQIAQLEALVRELVQVADEDYDTTMAIDEQFHKLFYQAAANEFLATTLCRLHALSLRLWWVVLHRVTHLREAIAVHAEIIPALKARDEEQAETLMQEHLADFQARIKAAL
jgi:DNA-binding GntR family transcriptional regulator